MNGRIAAAPAISGYLVVSRGCLTPFLVTAALSLIAAVLYPSINAANPIGASA